MGKSLVPCFLDSRCNSNNRYAKVTSAMYLGVYLDSSFTFKCSFDVNKAKFYNLQGV